MRRRLIIFLIKSRLGLKTKQRFRFIEQRNKSECYCFTKDNLIKIKPTSSGDIYTSASVSLNWLLNDECKIELV